MVELILTLLNGGIETLPCTTDKSFHESFSK